MSSNVRTFVRLPDARAASRPKEAVVPIQVRNAAEVEPQVRPSIHGGDGSFEMRFVYGPGDLVSALRVFELCRMPPGTSIGEHLHDDTEEIYFVLSGVGVMSLDGEEREVRRGRRGAHAAPGPPRHPQPRSGRARGADRRGQRLIGRSVAAERQRSQEARASRRASPSSRIDRHVVSWSTPGYLLRNITCRLSPTMSRSRRKSAARSSGVPSQISVRRRACSSGGIRSGYQRS